VVIDDNAVVHNGVSYAEEIELFRRFCNQYKTLAEELNDKKDSNTKAYIHRSQDSMILRYMLDGEEKTIITTFVPSGAILGRKWRYEDGEVENSQGGITQTKGWYLE